MSVEYHAHKDYGVITGVSAHHGDVSVVIRRSRTDGVWKPPTMTYGGLDETRDLRRVTALHESIGALTPVMQDWADRISGTTSTAPHAEAPTPRRPRSSSAAKRPRKKKAATSKTD